MRRVAPDNPVRRCLFPAPDTDEARVDNFANALKDASAQEKLEKMRKWNFDFEKELPLQGTYEWYRCDGPNDWIGMDTTPQEKDEELSMQAQNEATPKGSKEEELPLLRKRKQDAASQAGDKGVRRRISFESE